jgi:hypothetical protein
MNGGQITELITSLTALVASVTALVKIFVHTRAHKAVTNDAHDVPAAR